MKKRERIYILIILLLFGCFLTAALWSSYTDFTAGQIADADTILVQDKSDTPPADGAMKEWPYSVMKSDLTTYFYEAAQDQIQFADSSGGEITTGNAIVSAIKHLSVTLDPGTWYDVDAEIFLFTVGDDFLSGFIIDEWKVSCNVDPDVEMDLDLKYADAWIGLANSAVIDVLDTTNGTSSEDTDANINGDAAVANAKVVYLSFGADPEGTCIQMIFEMWYHAVD